MLDVEEAARRLRRRSRASETESFRGTPCLLWTGHIDREGYPNKVQVGGRVTSAHRMAYWVAYGPIADGMQIDHRCHDPRTCSNDATCPHRRCINPLHLEAVTPRENTLRSAGAAAANARMRTCAKGHAWDKVHPSGRRRCSRCEQESARAEYARRTTEDRLRRNDRRRALDAEPGRRERKNTSARLAKRGMLPDECLNGHPYIDGSFRTTASGKRTCLVCRSIRNERRLGAPP